MGPIRFPNLGWEFNLPTGFYIGNFEIRFYGIIIALGLLAGALLAYHEAKRTGQKVDDYIDYTFFAVIGALICARIYYVAFEWDYYSANPKEIIDIRGGGIAIYGAVIGGAIALFIFAKVKKLKFFKMADTIIPGLLIGQIIGRWGNFFNREAFGCFTDGLFAPNQGLFPKYTSGKFKKYNTDMIVSRGLGNSLFPFRIFNRPELIVTTLNKQ